jgi:hypothetical protein
MEERTIEAGQVAVFSEILAEGEFIPAMDATLSGEPIILGCLGPMDEPPRFRYRIHVREGAVWTVVDVDDIGRTIGLQFVGRMDPETWIVAGGHSARTGETAVVLDDAGQILHRFDPGRDPQRVATTEDGQVWIVYGEEPRGPLHDHGLVALDERGELRFGFNSIADQHGLPSVFDCYALTATGPDEIWVCYYTDFPLVRIHGTELVEIHPDQPVLGARAFAVGSGRVLFAGAWGFPEGVTGDEPIDRDQPFESTKDVFRLLDLDSNRFEDLRILDSAGIEFDPRAHPAEGLAMFAKGSRVFLKPPEDLQVVDVNEL